MPSPLRVRYSRIRKLATQLVAEHAIIAPPVDVERVASSRGASIRYDDLGEGVSGILVRGHPGKAVIGVQRSHSLQRQRFTIAHELGHFLLHDGDEVHVDHVFRVNYRSDRPQDGVQIEETEANVFASELLMPVAFLDQEGDFIFDAEGGPRLAALSTKYQVSREAMSWRLLNLYRFHTQAHNA